MIIGFISLDSKGEQHSYQSSVSILCKAWEKGCDILLDRNDTIVSCILEDTQLYIETFGELMLILTGAD